MLDAFLNKEQDQDGERENEVLIRVALSALWSLTLELFHITYDLVDVKESPACAEHDTRIEEQGFKVQELFNS